MTDFEKYARGTGISSITLSRYTSMTGNYISPVVPEEHSLNVSSMDVFSRLMMDRIVFVGVPIDDNVANIVQAQLLYLASNDPKKDIIMYVNTPGGQVTSGLAIYDTMQLIAPTVSTVCTGLAASMGSILLAGGEIGKRFALPHSTVLVHQPLGGTNGKAEDMIIAAREIEKTRDVLVKILAERTGQDSEKIFTDILTGDKWMNAQEALDYGIIDGILTKQ